VSKEEFCCYAVSIKEQNFVNKIQRQEVKRALIGFLLTPFWLAKDAL
jgi:hypothetical protein